MSYITLNGTGYGSNNNSGTYVVYCWHEVPGFSRFGSYTGNGNNNGPFIYLGFKPAWMMVKQTNTTNYWAIFDTTRKTFNPNTRRLAPNYNYVEDDRGESAAGSNAMDFLSNGIKMRGNDTTSNQSGGSYVYFAFAEHPFNKGKKLPVYVANFVLMDYGTGAIFGCPAHDQRDLDFAKKYKLEIKEVVSDNPSKPKNFSEACKKNTRLFFAESLGNPKLDVLDLDKISLESKKCKVPFMVDNTVATPALLNPIKQQGTIGKVEKHLPEKYYNGLNVVCGYKKENSDSFV